MFSDHDERRPLLTDAEVLAALAHPVRLDLLTYLMAARIDALLRPLIAAHRTDAPPSAELVHVNVFAFPRTGEPWQRARR